MGTLVELSIGGLILLTGFFLWLAMTQSRARLKNEGTIYKLDRRVRRQDDEIHDLKVELKRALRAQDELSQARARETQIVKILAEGGYVVPKLYAPPPTAVKKF